MTSVESLLSTQFEMPFKRLFSVFWPLRKLLNEVKKVPFFLVVCFYQINQAFETRLLTEIVNDSFNQTSYTFNALLGGVFR